MIHVDALDFSEWHSEEVISFFWRSVYMHIYTHRHNAYMHKNAIHTETQEVVYERTFDEREEEEYRSIEGK